MKPVSPEEKLFTEALLRDSPEARAAYLEAACGTDPVLRRRVEALLRAAGRAGDFLEHPPDQLSHGGEALWRGNDSREGPPGQVGPLEMLRAGRYRLLEKIGEGGCGTVYLAEQEEPVRRRVALKIIKLGMDTQQVVARFEAERQALSLMDHPHIARVFDGGATEKGRPYFVMELVRGLRITRFCDEARVSLEGRIRLFIQVCQAVQHAHQKGVIHRDLKPSNILVTVNDGLPVPKVIDFGIAKAVGHRLTDKTVFTQFQSFLGTPAYTSPEQAGMSSVDVDTRSDIYSLGVLLYELLTGHTPFDGEKLLSSGLDEMRRIIREDMPALPSTCLAARYSGKNTGPERIRSVRGDLDWIVMKCLEKDRARRYDTAIGLAADLQRHLDHEPIQARPVSALGRLWRWRQRRPAVAALSTAVLALLLVVAVGSTVAAWRVTAARQAELSHRQQAEMANRDLVKANARLAETVNLLELQRAENRFQAQDSPAGVAYLTALLRRDPSQALAASRLVSALIHRNWALPVTSPMRHPDRVMSAEFSPEGLHVLSASWDKTARIWDAVSGHALATLPHGDRVLSARYSPDGTRIVTASADGTARVWRATNGLPLLSFDHRSRQVWWAEFSPDSLKVVTASPGDNTGRIWDVVTGGMIRELSSHSSEVMMARFAPDGQRVATGSRWGSIRLWDAETGQTLLSFVGHQQAVLALAFSPGGSLLASAGQDHTARLWNAQTGQPAHPPLFHDDAVHDVVFSPDGDVLLTTSQDNTARLWNVRTGQLMGRPLPHEGGVIFGAFSPDGKTIVTTSMDNSARLWEVATGRLLCQPLRESEAILHAGFSPDGSRLVTASWDGNVKVWSLEPRRYLELGMAHEKAVASVAFDPRGERVLTASSDHTARLWDARNGQALGPAMLHPGPVQSADFSADGRQVLTASEDGAARIWDAGSGQLVTELLGHAKTVCFARFSPDGKQAVTASEDGTARVWDARTGRPVTPPMEHGAIVKMTRFSPDGRWVVTASDNGSARVWNARTGRPVTGPLSHSDHVEWAEFSPDNQRVVTASSDNTARLWDARTGLPLGLPMPHTRTVMQAVFNADGSLLATASLDCTARIWDAKTGRALTNPLVHDQSLSQVSFCPDGRRILTSGWNNRARLWDVVTGCPLTEWLMGDGIGFRTCWDGTGGRMVSGSHHGGVGVWELPSAPTPVPAWFLRLAEAVAGLRLSDQGQMELVAEREFEGMTRQVAMEDRNEFYGRLGHWFLADPAHRPASPF